MMVSARARRRVGDPAEAGEVGEELRTVARTSASVEAAAFVIERAVRHPLRIPRDHVDIVVRILDLGLGVTDPAGRTEAFQEREEGVERHGCRDFRTIEIAAAGVDLGIEQANGRGRRLARRGSAALRNRTSSAMRRCS